MPEMTPRAATPVVHAVVEMAEVAGTGSWEDPVRLAIHASGPATVWSWPRPIWRKLRTRWGSNWEPAQLVSS